MYKHVMKLWMMIIGFSAAALIVFAILFAVFFKSHKVEKFSEEKKLVLVFSTSCTYCTIFKPTFEKYVMDHPHIKFELLDTSSAEAAPYNSKITGFPATLVVSSENTVIDTLVGNQSYENLDKFVKKQK